MVAPPFLVLLAHTRTHTHKTQAAGRNSLNHSPARRRCEPRAPRVDARHIRSIALSLARSLVAPAPALTAATASRVCVRVCASLTHTRSSEAACARHLCICEQPLAQPPPLSTSARARPSSERERVCEPQVVATPRASAVDYVRCVHALCFPHVPSLFERAEERWSWVHSRPRFTLTRPLCLLRL